MPCHNCGSDKTEVDNASGISVCVNCGVVSFFFFSTHVIRV